MLIKCLGVLLFGISGLAVAANPLAQAAFDGIQTAIPTDSLGKDWVAHPPDLKDLYTAGEKVLLTAGVHAALKNPVFNKIKENPAVQALIKVAKSGLVPLTPELQAILSGAPDDDTVEDMKRTAAKPPAAEPPEAAIGQALGSLSALNGALPKDGKLEMKPFQGKPMHCRSLIGMDCCSILFGEDGIDCSKDERTLMAVRKEGRSVFVGRYCKHTSPLGCLEHHQVYCVFGSREARIVQEGGRKGQLGIGFGDAKHPDCRALTEAEFEGLDFGKIPLFSEMDASLNGKLRTPSFETTPIDEAALGRQQPGEM